MTKQVYNKLVRDLIPSRIRAKGEQVCYKRLPFDRYEELLTAKLNEEVAEYHASQTDDECIMELVDILEVVYALTGIHGYTPEELELLRQEKLKTHGAFEEGIFLVSTNSDGGKDHA